jgi:hypothetical protein
MFPFIKYAYISALHLSFPPKVSHIALFLR